MYIGSVRFFKHLIVVVILIIVIGLTVSTICLGFMNQNYQAQIADIQSQTALAHSNPKEEVQQNSLSIEYQNLYPDLYSKLPKATKSVPNTVYLTFDDGPSDRTNEILDILKEENIKATFFIIGKEGEKEKQIMNRIVEEGHAIGIHTYSHIYTSIYESVESFLEDYDRTNRLIYDTTGVKTGIFRFPGGSINQYDALFYEEIIAEMTRRGYTYYDWNASSGDADSHATVDSVYNNVVRSSSNKTRIILLMHDSLGKRYTVTALPRIIEYYRGKGYQFEALTNDVSPITFSYKNYE